MTKTPRKTLKHYVATAYSPIGKMPVRYAAVFHHIHHAKGGEVEAVRLAETLGFPRPLIYRIISTLSGLGLAELSGGVARLTEAGKAVAQKIEEETDGR